MADELELARLKYAAHAHRWETGCGVARTFFRCTFGVVIGYFAYKTVGTVAGTTTVFLAALKATVNVGADRWVAYIVGSCGVGGYMIERRNKQKAVEGMKGEIDALRDAVNRGRSRSGLNPRGKPSKNELKND